MTCHLVTSRISLAKAALLFDPPKSRKAIDQLHRREVLKCWREGGRLYTSESAIRAYVASSPRHNALREPGKPMNETSKVDALERVIGDLSAENAALRVRLAMLESRGS